jgi:hypothetical protein
MTADGTALLTQNDRSPAVEKRSEFSALVQQQKASFLHFSQKPPFYTFLNSYFLLVFTKYIHHNDECF